MLSFEGQKKREFISQQFRVKFINSLTMMLASAFLIMFFGFLDFHSALASMPSGEHKLAESEPFTDLLGAFAKWDSEVGCSQFKLKHQDFTKTNGSASVQDVDGEMKCSVLKMNHVGVLLKGWTWLPDYLDNLYSCRCGLSCLWTKNRVLVDKPDALLFETTTSKFLVCMFLKFQLS